MATALNLARVEESVLVRELRGLSRSREVCLQVAEICEIRGLLSSGSTSDSKVVPDAMNEFTLRSIANII
jgi:hypothetical protein